MLLMDTNARILNSLSLKNSDLERCQDVFSSIWLKYEFHVKTFQEGLPLKIPFRLGQSKMAKVVPDGDVPLLAQVSISRDDQEKAEHFKFRGMFLRQLAVSVPADNTCQWLRDTPSFRVWTERKNTNAQCGLLQIIGKPGSGKSTLMRSILEATRSLAHKRNDGTYVVGHFFNRRGQSLETCAKGMLHSILYQLITLHPPCLSAFMGIGLADLQTLESTIPESYLGVLESSLKRIFSDPSLAPWRTVFFIDALDECDPSEAAEAGYFLAELTNLARKNGVRLGVCISRREYPSITVRDCLEIRMEAYNLQDIRQYISQKLGLAGVSPQDASALQETVAQRSNGIFLWVVLAVEGILKDFESGQNAKHILKRTKSLPKALEDLFAQILDRIDPANLSMTLRLLQWAVLPTDRLRIREWHHILAFLREEPPRSLAEWKESVYFTETDAQLERQIRDLSRGLVEVKGGLDVDSDAGEVGSLLAGAGSLDSTTGDSRVVQPIHPTVVDFLASGRANSLFMQGPGYDFIGEGHLAIASVCLDYIAIAELDKLAAARKHQQDLHDGLPIFPWRGDWPLSSLGDAYARPKLRRRHSATSFMSSASSYSTKYYHQSVEEDDFPPEPRTESSWAVHAESPVVSSANSQTLEEYPALASLVGLGGMSFRKT
ncbi:hypothetical protein NEMBOFW57_008328 [Staphylotrichum longicolle]|uniref:Nephrocystin 3-like N-terminal domain-containing protein n=1 Tax=Staphylotrichum longicolle TaxID=669026 RepID=A0AAD4ERH5_9PEZI|nr:hypothetical protein NEMBOFW57_008328 [Staphylotrichum longicolle]